jgi:putative spermidine/putrescine transport system permease protein
MPAMRRLLESVTILPIVIPPVVLIIGVLQVMPLSLRASVWMLGLEYVILAMPFAYRALDAGLRAIDVKTLTEASNSLGGGLFTTLWRVLLPNLRTAVLSATILIVAMVLGEFTMASLALKETFPVWIVLFDQLNANISVAASFFALFVTWLFLMMITVIATRQSRRTGGAEVTLFSVAPRETIGN